MQPAAIRLAAAWADRAGTGRSKALYWLGEQFLSGVAPGGSVPPPREGPAAAGTALGAASQGGWPQPGVELGHHLPADHGARCVALPLSGGRRLEPQSGGLGCGRGGVGSDRS